MANNNNEEQSTPFFDWREGDWASVRCDMAGGGAAALVGTIIGYPLETIKVRQQAKESKVTFVDAVKQIYEHRGIKGYFRGFTVPLVASGFLSATFFGVYGLVLDQLLRKNPGKHGMFRFLEKEQSSQHLKHVKAAPLIQTNTRTPTYFDVLIAGLAASLVQTGLSCPVDVIKTQMQSAQRRQIFHTPWNCFWTIYKFRGIRGLYSGLVPTCLRNMSAGFLNTLFIAAWFRTHPVKIDNYAAIIPVAGVAGTLSWWLTAPLDVLKTKLQTQNPFNPTFKGMVKEAKKIWVRRGIEGFFRGLIPLSMRAFPVQGISYVAFAITHTHYGACSNSVHENVRAVVM